MLPAPPRPVDAFVEARTDDFLERIEDGLEMGEVEVEVEGELLVETRMVFPAPPRPVWM